MRINNLDGLRAIAAIGILMMHYQCNLASPPEYGIISERIIPWFTNFVFLFFIVSAFGMCCGYYEKVKNGMPPTIFYKKRYAHLLPFYALLCVADVAAGFSFESIYQAFANLTFTNGLLVRPDAITVIGVGWFLGVVFLFYMMFPFFVFMIQNKRTAWFSLAVTAILCALGLTYFLTPSFAGIDCTNSARTYIICSAVFFVTGGIIYLYKDAIFNMVEGHSKIIRLLGLIAIAASLCFINPENILLLWGSYLLITTLMLICCLGPDTKLLSNKYIRFIGKYSFEIYLSHMLIFRVMERMHLLDVIKNPQINYIVIVVAGLTGAVILAVSFNKIWTFMSNKLLAYRK